MVRAAFRRLALLHALQLDAHSTLHASRVPWRQGWPIVRDDG
jgi:hypothetical protein